MNGVAKSSGLTLVALLWAVLLAVIGSAEILLFTIPVFMLAAPLALGRYVGERVIARIARIVATPRIVRSEPGLRLLAGHTTRVALALAARISGRAPPLPA